MNKPKKTSTAFSATQVARVLAQRANTLPNITPELITSWHANFRRGSLRAAAIAWEQIIETDDMVVSVAPKREKAVARHGFEVITVDDSPKAKKHKETLERFYNNIVATNAIDQNERGGFPMLVRQMMKSVGFKYAVHEIVWQPGEVFSAEFRFVPLWFFENLSGKLRFLPTTYGIEGEEMLPGEWMVTTGQGIMAATTACWLFKHLPLQDWLIFSERFGMGNVWGESNDPFESDAWNAMVDALEAIAAGDPVVVSSGSKINAMEYKQAGALPYDALIDRMDRAIATMWRGGDLSTISSDAVGAEMQDDEKDTLENDDSRNITDVLNEQVDKYVIKYVHGDAVPLAWVKVRENVQQDVKLDLDIDKGLLEMGYEEPVEELQKRYGRPQLQKKVEILTAESSADTLAAAENEAPVKPTLWRKIKNLVAAGNVKDESETLKKNARGAIAQAIEMDLRPVAIRVAEILDTTADEDLEAALTEFRDYELPDLLEQIADEPGSAEAYAQTLTASYFNGIEEGGTK